MSYSNQLIERLEEIQRLVALYYKLDVEELLSPSRPNRLAHPRMLAMYLVRRESDLSLMEIGQRFGGRNHGTVIHACRRIEETIKNKPELTETISKILAGEDPDQLKLF